MTGNDDMDDLPFDRKRIKENPSPPTKSEDSQHNHIMDDISHGQWSKNNYGDENSDNKEKDNNSLEPSSLQRTFRKVAKKFSRQL